MIHIMWVGVALFGCASIGFLIADIRDDLGRPLGFLLSAVFAVAALLMALIKIGIVLV